MKEVLSKALDFVFPENIYCCCCGDVMDKSRVHGICDSCISKLDWIKENPFSRKMEGFFFDDMISLVGYDLYSQNIVHNLKFHSKPYIARGIGRLMGELFATYYNDKSFVFCPVPMHKEKEIKRGYNQADLLCYYASLSCGSRFEKDLLIKTKETASMRLARAEGRSNVLEGSIATNEEKIDLINDQRVVLVDDVVTTGITADLCAKNLKKAGADKVIVLSFAISKYRG